ncbi:hypothetical protein SLA2020_285030 [Shorea laevis]
MVATWQAPPAGYVKLNWDAAVDEGNRRMGIGVIARDHTGEVVVTVSALNRNYRPCYCRSKQLSVTY